METHKHDTIHDYINELFEIFKPLISSYGGVKKISGIGIGAPNGNYYSGNIEHAANLKWKGIVPLAKLTSEKFGLKVKLTNDANAAAIGEIRNAANKIHSLYIISPSLAYMSYSIFLGDNATLGDFKSIAIFVKTRREF